MSGESVHETQARSGAVAPTAMSLERQIAEIRDRLRNAPRLSVEDSLHQFQEQFKALGFTPAMSSAYRDVMPALALGLRLHEDHEVGELVKTLSRTPLANRAAQARGMADGLPRGAGRRVVVELLLRAAADGPSAFVTAAAFACSADAAPGDGDARRTPKDGERHNFARSCVEQADLAVRRLVVRDPGGIQPDATRSKAAAEQRLRAFVQEAAAHVLGHGERDSDGGRAVPLSRAQARRPRPHSVHDRKT